MPQSTTRALRVADLSHNAATPFDLRPDAAALQGIARDLGLLALRKLSFQGTVSALGQHDWELQATLGATVVQPCVVTLEPVTTRIDVPVVRRFIRDFVKPDAPEAEMPEDDTIEPLGTFIDPEQVMTESLALALPDYPRKEGADLEHSRFAKPGTTPMSDDEAKPFAGLAGLRDSLKKDP